MGDRAKYFGLIFGVSFATLLMAQQVSIFWESCSGRPTRFVDVRDAEIWVMDNKVRFIDEVPALPDTDLLRVRGVPAASSGPCGSTRGRCGPGWRTAIFATSCCLASTMKRWSAHPQTMMLGSWPMRQPDAVIIDKAGYEYMWPGEPYRARPRSSR